MPSLLRSLSPLAVLLLAMAGMAGLVPWTVPAAESQTEALPFRLPAGFVAEKVAGPPLIGHPVMAGFDEQGRLYVAETAGRNLRVDDLLRERPNRIVRLTDSKGTGRFDQSTVFADNMTFPMGALWYRSGLYACAHPSLWRLEDPDGKGIAGKRTELVSRFGSNGNAADIHGPFLGPDGWLYWTDGRHGHEIKQADGRTLQGKAARIFRCRPDGSGVERVCGGGMDNPVEIAFTAEGEALATVDILIGSPSRNDAIIHCIEGGVFPYYLPVLGEFKRTGPLLPPVTFLGWVAPSGLMRYQGTGLGAEYEGNLFSTQFNTHKVIRHILERQGATFRTKDEDFLTSENPDFHPTDVLEDADGSLLVIDTGGWFRIGCPTSQIAKPEIKGGIYRIRRKDAAPIDDPRGFKLNWKKPAGAELVQRLDDPRPAVRERAIHALREQGEKAVPALTAGLSKPHSVTRRRNAVWALSGIAGTSARSALRLALGDADFSVRLAAVHAVGLWRDSSALSRLQELVVDDQPAICREAATALGRMHDVHAVPSLLESASRENDRFLEHALIYALIEIADREATGAGLRDKRPAARRAALLALDQMDNGNLTEEQVAPLLDTDDANLQQTVLDIVAARPAWAGVVVPYFRQALAQPSVPAQRRPLLVASLTRLARDNAVQNLIGETLQRPETASDVRRLLLEVIGQAGGDKLPAIWLEELRRHLDSGDPQIRYQTVVTLRSRGVTTCDDRLQHLAGDARQSAELRVLALAALGPRLTEIKGEYFDFLCSRLQPDLPPLERLAAAEALGQCRLSDTQLLALCAALSRCGALEMPPLLSPFANGQDAAVGRRLVQTLAESPALPSLSAERLAKVLERYPEEVRQAAGPLFKRLAQDLDKQKARLAELESVLLVGNPQRGRSVFFGTKAVCSACHTVQGNGGKVGPELTKIGSIRTGRDLLEAIVFPSSSIVRGYESYLVQTHSGRQVTGLIGRETADSLFLINAERHEVRIARSDVESIQPSRLSLMPQGMDAQLTRQELGDLIAFLQGLK